VLVGTTGIVRHHGRLAELERSDRGLHAQIDHGDVIALAMAAKRAVGAEGHLQGFAATSSLLESMTTTSAEARFGTKTSRLSRASTTRAIVQQSPPRTTEE
jgi:hypothetical protein